MSNQESEGFGFKDKQKALDTIKQLEDQDSQYRALTIRGLLGRAKRVLTMTKAEEKRTNIQQAIEVFEKWIEENKSASAKNKSTKSNADSEEKIDKVPGLGFKDKDAAEKTLKILDNRDADYQKLAIKGLITSSKTVIARTKDKEKITAIKEGIDILTDYLDSLDTSGQPNMKYLPVDIIQHFPKPSEKLVSQFLTTYTDTASGNYKKLRTLFPDEDDDNDSWDIVRNKNLKKQQKIIDDKKLSLFNSDGSPTKEHLMLISWAYTPKLEKLKQYIDKKEKNNDSASDEPSTKKRKV
ncbi:mitotic apparatus protein p62 [Sergentomyia squamirostris]